MPATGTSFLVSILPAGTAFISSAGPGTATAFLVASQPTATSWIIEGGGAVATSFIVSRLPTATSFIVGQVADAVIDYSVDLRTCGTVTVTYPDNPLVSEQLVLEAKDLETGDSLRVVGGLVSTNWVWTVTSTVNQVIQLSISGDDEPVSTPVLLNCRALKVIANLSKEGQHVHSGLQQLLVYNALATLLFNAGDYVTCAAYLHLLDDLTPCGCGC